MNRFDNTITEIKQTLRPWCENKILLIHDTIDCMENLEKNLI